MPIGAAVALAGCGIDDGRRTDLPFEPTSGLYQPAARVAFDADREVPLEFAHIAADAPGTLLVVEKKSDVLWEVPLSGKAPRRLAEFREAGRTVMAGFDVSSAGVSAVDLTGRIATLNRERTSFVDVARRFAIRGTALRSFVRGGDGASYLLEIRTAVDRRSGLVFDTVTVSRVDSTSARRVEYSAPRTDPNRPLAFIEDAVSLQMAGDTLFLAASSPPRILRWLPGSVPRADTLVGVPVRAIAGGDREEFRRQLLQANPAFGRIQRQLDRYPSVFAARPAARGLFVVAVAGTQRFALDYYCKGTFVATLLDHPGMEAITLLAEGAVVVRPELERSRVFLEYYPYAAFGRNCA